MSARPASPSPTDVGTSLGVIAASRGRADLWYARVGAHLGELEQLRRSVLSSDEAEHTRRYRSREASERYVVTRSLTRLVLASHLRLAPPEIPVKRTDRGKPVVDGVHFNVSHSGDLILLVVSDQCPVGVDVERRRDIPRVDALSRRWLTTAERDEVARRQRTGLTPSDAFLGVWSMKEAGLKALGIGISGAAVANLDVETTALDEVLAPLARDDDRGYVGAVAFA